MLLAEHIRIDWITLCQLFLDDRIRIDKIRLRHIFSISQCRRTCFCRNGRCIFLCQRKLGVDCRTQLGGRRRIKFRKTQNGRSRSGCILRERSVLLSRRSKFLHQCVQLRGRIFLCNRLSLQCQKEIAALRGICGQCLQKVLHCILHLRIAELIRRQAVSLQNVDEGIIQALMHIRRWGGHLHVYDCRKCCCAACRSDIIRGHCCFLCTAPCRLCSDFFRCFFRHILCVLRGHIALHLRCIRLRRIGGSVARLCF